MDLNENSFPDQTVTHLQKQPSNGIRVRDMIRKYDTASKSDSAKTSYSSILSSKSSYFVVNASNTAGVNPPEDKVQDIRDASSLSSGESLKTIRHAKSPRMQMQNDVQIAPLEKQKSFMNLSRSREPPKAAPKEKKPRHSASQEQAHMDTTDSSYHSKTTISKTPSGVRIVIDIFFEQNGELTVQDIVGSRIETDIPPSKILTEFQRRVALRQT